MNKYTKIGLTALAGSLVAGSVSAATMSASGSAATVEYYENTGVSVGFAVNDALSNLILIPSITVGNTLSIEHRP